MTDFKAKTHPNRFRLGLRPRPRCGSLQRSPDLWLNLRGPRSKVREGKWRKREGKKERRDGMGKGRNDLPYDLGDLEMTWLL